LRNNILSLWEGAAGKEAKVRWIGLGRPSKVSTIMGGCSPYRSSRFSAWVSNMAKSIGVFSNLFQNMGWALAEDRHLQVPSIGAAAKASAAASG
jgi:hypothetical protein